MSEGVPHTFTWAHAGSDVKVTGDWNGWREGIVMKPDATGTFSATTTLGARNTWSYKFVVDGNWVYDPTKPFYTDQFGNINNFVSTNLGGAGGSTPEPLTDSGAFSAVAPESIGVVRSRPGSTTNLDAVDLAPVVSTPSGPGDYKPGNYGDRVERDLAAVEVTEAVDTPSSDHGGMETPDDFPPGAGAGLVPILEAAPAPAPGEPSATVVAATRELESEFSIPVPSPKVPLRRSVSAVALKSNAAGVPPALPVVVPVPPKRSDSGRSLSLGQTQSGRREGKLVLAMVGLPARGKTFIARKLHRHLTWMGYNVHMCNVGNFRRKLLGPSQRHDFFNPDNEEGQKMRRKMAETALAEMLDALCEGADIGIYDATNTTKARRDWLAKSLRSAGSERGINLRLVYIESICTDERVIRSNVRETKLKSPDYKDLDETAAVADFLKRIAHYVSVYQPVDDDEGCYIKLIDVGRKLIAHRINGFLNSRILFFLQNLHITPHPIWITRHGESEYNTQGRIGGDPGLSPRGHAYAQRLAVFIKSHYPPGTELTVWTSCLRRTQITAGYMGREMVHWRALNEIDAGVCDGMTYEAIAATMPDEYAARAADKYHYRYPRGESYQDIVHRLEPVLIELMRMRNPVLIVSHQATLRVLYAYLTDRPPSTCPELLMPLHTCVQLTLKAYKTEEVRHELM